MIKGDDIRQNSQKVNLTIKDAELTMSLNGQTMLFQIEHNLTGESFRLEFTPEVLFQDSMLPILFPQPINLLQYLSKNPQELTISTKGLIEFTVNIMDSPRKLAIQTIKVEEQNPLEKILKIFQKTQREVKQIKQRLGMSQISSMKSKLSQKDISQNLKQSSKMHKFEAENKDWHYYLFDFYVNRIKKKDGKSKTYQSLFGKELAPYSTFSFKVLQINVIDNKIMYGVGSNRIRGRDDAEKDDGNSTLFQSYDSGRVYPGGTNCKTESVKNGEVIEVIIDTFNWKVTWKKNSIQLATSIIPEKIRLDALFPVIMMYNVGDEIQIVS